jgi:hypothetical protein
MSVAAMAPFTAGTAWDQHRPFVSSPLSSSPIRASSPQSPLSDRSSNIPSREIQSSPIRKATVFDKFSRFASKSSPRFARHRQRKSDTREIRRQEFLDNVRKRADERTFQRRDMEGTVRPNFTTTSSATSATSTDTAVEDDLTNNPGKSSAQLATQATSFHRSRCPLPPDAASPEMLVARGALKR